jgi:hypothetical protein
LSSLGFKVCWMLDCFVVFAGYEPQKKHTHTHLHLTTDNYHL